MATATLTKPAARGGSFLLESPQASDVFTPADLSDDQKLIGQTAEEFVVKEVVPFVKDLENKKPGLMPELVKKGGEVGLMGGGVPEEYGGAGLDKIATTVLTEKLSIYGGFAVTHGAHAGIGTLPIVYFGTEAQKKKYLRRLATGEMIGAFCLTEPAAGSDAAGIQARAIAMNRVGSGLGIKSAPGPSLAPGAAASWAGVPLGTPGGDIYRLNGTKVWVSNGSIAGVFIVFAKTDPDAGGKGITAFLVEPSFPGFKVGRHEDKMGQRTSPAVEVLLNDCEVPRENRLGEEGQGLRIALSTLDGGRIGIAALALGLAQGALDESVKYAKQRHAFGKTISDFQAIQWMLADMQTEIEAARGLVYHAAWLKDNHPTQLGAAASKAKLYASEMANRVVYKAVQIHGSVGYSRETDVERIYRDARVVSIYEGTSEIQRMIIARELLGVGPKQSVAAR